LRGSRLKENDALLIFSVGGGNREKNVSTNLVMALEFAHAQGAAVFGIVGRDGGVTRQIAEASIVVPPLFPARITPHTEGICAVLWHLLVSHPDLQTQATKWESVR
jgi:D-sedoheptulose 7-phosphate isomerase